MMTTHAPIQNNTPSLEDHPNNWAYQQILSGGSVWLSDRRGGENGFREGWLTRKTLDGEPERVFSFPTNALFSVQALETKTLQRGYQLDWAVALACSNMVGTGYWRDQIYCVVNPDKDRFRTRVLDVYSPSQLWAQGGPILEAEEIYVKGRYVKNPGKKDVWDAYKTVPYENHWKGTLVITGETYLEAAMRCFVYSRFGDTVNLPILPLPVD